MRVKAWLVLILPIIFSLSSCGGPSSSSLPPPPPPQNSLTPAPPAPSPVPVPPPPVHFFTFGDWGTGDANQRAVADQTQSVCLNRQCDFGLFLGDNFYDTGVSSVDDPQWQTKYRDMYGPLQIPLYAVSGNHDWDPPANPQAEIDFDLLDKDPYWRMPAFNYSFSYPEQGDPVLEIFVINSNNFATDTAAQTWLNQAITGSVAPWKILAFHHPIFTNGPHPSDEKGIYTALRPIICGKVHLLLSGHDHLFSHLSNNADSCGYDQLVVGTGGRTLYDAISVTNLIYTEKNFGLGFFEVTPTDMTLRFFRTDGTESYSTSWQKP